MAIKKHKHPKLRFWIQLFFFAWVALITVANSILEKGGEVPAWIGAASLHAICPLGGVVAFWDLATLGLLVKKVHESSLVLAGIGVVLALLFGPVLCGWICPFGTFQEWIGRLGRKIFKKRYNKFVPTKLDGILRYLRYVVLIWVIVMTSISTKLIFQDYDPYYALFNFWSSEVALSGYIILAIVMLLSLFVERPFCKYACPYGAFLGIFNLFRVFKIRRVESTCISCSKCDKSCPMNIEVSSAGALMNQQCISCMECTSESACPVAKTVTFSSKWKNKVLSTRAVAILGVAILIGGVMLSGLLGWWKTTSSKQPILIKDGEFAGMPSPSDIRGSYTYADITKAFGVPSDVLVKAFSASSATDKVNALEGVYAGKLPEGVELGTDSVRLFVAIYTGLPHESEVTTILPSTAIEVLKQEGKTGDPRFSQFEQTAIDVSGGAVLSENVATAAPEASAVTKVSITGKTTFGELLDAGYSREQIEKITGPIPSKEAIIKSIAEAKGIEFSDMKDALSAL